MELTLENKKGFSVANALALAIASQDAYTAQPQIRNDMTDTSVVLFETPEYLRITFPGTRDIPDVLKDLNCLRVSRNLGGVICGVHRGFDQAFESVRDDIGNTVGKIISARPKPIWIGGHSKGGGMTTRCAEFLCSRKYPVAGAYTFGEPRGGDGTYARHCDDLCGEIHFRVEDESDAITHLPGLIAGNRHSGQNILINSIGSYNINPNPALKILFDGWEIYQAKRSGPLALLALGNDHHIGVYIKRLKTLNGISNPIC